MAQPAFPEGIDFTDPDIYAERMPFEEFAELRKELERARGEARECAQGEIGRAHV